MKTINELEQEAQQAREVAIATTNNPFELMSTKIDSIILASVAMVTYQFALGMQEVSGDGSGESLPEYIENKGLINIAANQDYLTGDGSGKSLPEVSQEERDIDGDCHVNQYDRVDYGLGDGTGYYKNRHRS